MERTPLDSDGVEWYELTNFPANHVYLNGSYVYDPTWTFNNSTIYVNTEGVPARVLFKRHSGEWAIAGTDVWQRLCEGVDCFSHAALT